jgi:Fur family ferric uptake transcriptional regulator
MNSAPLGWDRVLKDHGYRITAARQLVLEAVESLDHATPEGILAHVQRSASGVNLSTVYRTLEVLEEVGLITHAHIGHGAPAYHPVAQDPHIHLVCERCDAVLSVDAALANDFVAAIDGAAGFRTDVTHMSLHGVCKTCAGSS